MDSGLFSHVFFETGNLGKKDPFLRWKHHQTDSEIYDLASITKSIATGPLILDYMQTTSLNDSSVISDWASIDSIDQAISKTKIVDLLAHKSGLRPWINLYVNNLLQLDVNLKQQNRSKIIDSLFQRNDLFRKGINVGIDCYSDVGFIILGRLLELNSGKNLGQLWTEFKDKVLGENLIIGYRNQFGEPNDSFISTGYCKIRQRET